METEHAIHFKFNYLKWYVLRRFLTVVLLLQSFTNINLAYFYDNICRIFETIHRDMKKIYFGTYACALISL